MIALTKEERTHLYNALRGNAFNGETIITDPVDTSFAGTTFELPDDEEVICAIKSVPVHYAR